LGCGMSASCAVVSATMTFGSANRSSTAHYTAYSLMNRAPSSPINSMKS
jgi:hypothetical protein